MAWNVVGVVVLAVAAITARSVALGGSGLDWLIEIGASTVVIWELSGPGEDRQRLGLQVIGVAFVVLACYLALQSTVTADRAIPSLRCAQGPPVKRRQHLGVGDVWAIRTSAG